MNTDMMTGETVFFGRYPQGPNSEIMPIEWRVLDVQDGRALLLSQYILDVRPFAGEDGNRFWGFCGLRGWLNREFLHRAFTPGETERIAQSENPDYDDHDVFVWELFEMEDTTDGIRDRVFLLSYTDVQRYFPGEQEGFLSGASAGATEWVYHQYEDEADPMGMCYWLRSASAQSDIAYIVSPVDSVGAAMGVQWNRHGVRPAIWIRR